MTLSRDAAASETLATVSLKLLRSTGIGDSLEGWEILREEGERLSFDQKVSELVRDRWSGSISVTLRLAMTLPGRTAASEDESDETAKTGGPRLPKPRGAAPITRHEIHLPNVNDVTRAGDADTDLDEGSMPPPAPEKKVPAVQNGQAARRSRVRRCEAGIEADDGAPKGARREAGPKLMMAPPGGAAASRRRSR